MTKNLGDIFLRSALYTWLDTLGVHPRLVGRTVWVLTLAGFCFVFAFLLSSAQWILAGMLFAIVAGVVALIIGFDRIALFWVVGIPFLFTYVNNVAAAIPSFTMGRFLFVVLIGMLTAQVFLRLRPGRKLDAVEKASLAFLTWVFLAMILRWVTKDASDWRPDGALFLTGYAMPLGAYGIARRVRWTQARKRLVLIGSAVNGALLGVVSIAQYVFGLRIFDATFIETQHQGEAFERAVGTFGSSWELGLVTALCGIIGVCMLTQARSAPGRVVIAGMIGATLVGLALCLTRAPWLSFVLGLGALCLFDTAVRRFTIPFVILGAVLGFIAAPIVMSSPEVAYRLTDISSILNRVALYVTSINMSIQNPLFGVGLGVTSFVKESSDYIINFGIVQGNWMLGVTVPHNEFLFIAATSGLPALGMFIYIMWKMTQDQLRTGLNSETPVDIRRLSGLAVGLLVAFVFVANTLDTSFGRYASLLTFFVVGMARASHTPPPRDAV